MHTSREAKSQNQKPKPKCQVPSADAIKEQCTMHLRTESEVELLIVANFEQQLVSRVPTVELDSLNWADHKQAVLLARLLAVACLP